MVLLFCYSIRLCYPESCCAGSSGDAQQKARGDRRSAIPLAFCKTLSLTLSGVDSLACSLRNAGRRIAYFGCCQGIGVEILLGNHIPTDHLLQVAVGMSAEFGA